MDKKYVNNILDRLIGIGGNISPNLKQSKKISFLFTTTTAILISILIQKNFSETSSILYWPGRNIKSLITFYILGTIIFFLIERFIFDAWPTFNPLAKILSLQINVVLTLLISYLIFVILFSSDLNKKFDVMSHSYVEIPNSNSEKDGLRETTMELLDLFQDLSDTAKVQKKLNEIKERLENIGPNVRIQISSSRLDKINLFSAFLKENTISKWLFALIFFTFLALFLVPIIYFNSLNQNQIEVKRIKKKSSSDQINIFSSIEHELGNKLPALRLDLNAFISYFSENPISSVKGDLEDKIRRPIPGENSANIDSVSDLLFRMENKLKYSIAVISNLKQVILSDPSKFNPRKINIAAFIEKEGNNLIKDNPNVSLFFSGRRDIELTIDSGQFSLLVDNLVRNAMRHGFTDINKKYNITIELEEEKKYINIIFKNNGDPLPPHYTLNSYKEAYNYAGKTGNSGLGGYIVNNVIENHDGFLEILQDVPKEDEFKVQFLIKLPKK